MVSGLALLMLPSPYINLNSLPPNKEEEWLDLMVSLWSVAM